jgi:Xaa-Pro dipeptidase
MREHSGLVFSLDEYQRRLRELRQRMSRQRLDVLLVTTPENTCYLTGYESPGHFRFQGLLVPLSGDPVMIPRQLEDSGVEALSWVEIRRPYQDDDDPMQVIAQTLTEFGWQAARIGYEKDCWFFTAAQQERLFAAADTASFVDASGMVEAGRVVKSDAEIALMRETARFTEASMRAGVDAVAAGTTENEIAAAMHHALIMAGSEWPAIAPFVASGHRGAIGHATWSGRVLQPGDVVMLEVAGCRSRYHTALMRSGVVGSPSEEVQRAAEIVHQAFDAMLDVIQPGIPASKPDSVAREIIAASGSVQVSRSAYSMGIALSPDWGEGHIISMQQGDEQLLRENMTFHVLPWVQIAGQGGISFSETIRITADGCELLTTFPRELFIG